MAPDLVRICLAAFSTTVALCPAAPAQEPPPPANEAQDPVVATVGTWPIRTSDLIAEINRQIPLVSFHQRVPPEKLREIRCDALDALVERSLIHQDALARNILVTDDELRETLRGALAKSEEYGDASDTQFEALLERYRTHLERRILLDKNEARFLAELPQVDDAALLNAYDRLRAANHESLLTPEEARIQQIFVAVDPSSSTEVIEEKQAKAEEALAQIRGGQPFEEVARSYSEGEYAEQGGEMGLVRKDQIRSSTLREAAFALQAGELSGLVRSLYGFHILRCQEVIPRRQRSFEEVRPTIEAWWTTEHRKQARSAWLARLREQYPVHIAPEEVALRERRGEDSGNDERDGPLPDGHAEPK